MTLEQKIRALIQEFRSAYYGEEVRRTYADIAELVCIEAMGKVDHVVDQGNYAEEQGDYAKSQGGYARDQGDYAKNQSDLSEEKTLEAIETMRLAMQQIEDEFGDIKDAINSTENGELLLRVETLINDLYKIATDEDIDRIIEGTYQEEDESGNSIFESCTDQDIDDIINGTYVEADEPGNTDDITEADIKEIVNNAFKEE